MSRLAQLAARAFNQGWMACGKPTMLVIGPHTEWTIPAWFSYDQSIDRIKDQFGEVVDDLSPYWTEYTVRCIPASALSEENVLGAGGIVQDGSTAVIILPADIDRLRHPHQVQFDSAWYDVSGLQLEPVGGIAPCWASIRLARRS